MTDELCPLCDRPIDRQNLRIEIDKRQYHWHCVLEAARAAAKGR